MLMKSRIYFPIGCCLAACFIVFMQPAGAQQAISQNRVPLPFHDFYHVRSGLPYFYNKVKERHPVTVAFLGGSITYNPGWRQLISRYLQGRFPQEKFHFINAGIPSLGSLPDVFRLQRDVLDSGKIDLMFVEAAVNDIGNSTDSITQIRDLEGIVRHAKRSNPDMGIVLMSFADPTKLKDYGEGRIKDLCKYRCWRRLCRVQN